MLSELEVRQVEALVTHLCSIAPAAIRPFDVIPLTSPQCFDQDDWTDFRFHVGYATGGLPVSGRVVAELFRRLVQVQPDLIETQSRRKHNAATQASIDLLSDDSILRSIDLKDVPVEWLVQIFDRSQPEPFPLGRKFLVLCWDNLADEQVREIMAFIHFRWNAEDPRTPRDGEWLLTLSMTQKAPDKTLHKFRSHFVELDSGAYAKRHEDFRYFTKSRSFHVDHDDRYVETPDGNPVSMLEVFQQRTGREDIYLMDDVETVLRFGPAPMQSTENWSQKSSTAIGQFLRVIEDISRSRWMKSGISMTTAKGPDQSSTNVELDIPDLDDTRSVLTLFRQLVSGDGLFGQCCNNFKRFSSSEAKRSWVEFYQDHFNNLLKAKPVLPSLPVENRELLELLFYGTQIMHAVSDKDAEGRLEQLLNSQGQEAVTMAMNSTLRHILGYANAIYHVVRQDFDHWLKEGATPPKVVDAAGMFRSYRKD